MVQRPASEPGEDFGATLRSMPRFCCRPRRVIGLLVAAGILFVAAHSFSLPEYNYSSPAGAYAEIDPDSPTPLSISQENADTKPDADPWLEEAELRTIMERDAEANTRFQSEQAIIRDQILKSLGPAVIGSGPSPAPPSALPAAKVEAGGAAAQGYTAGTALNSLPSPPPPPPPLIIGPAIPSPLQAAPTPVPARSSSGSRTADQIQHQQPGADSLTERQKSVVSSMQWAWKGYKQSAWGRDELHPVSQTASDWFGLGLTLIDALDTLWLMGLNEEFAEAREWVSTSFHPEMTRKDVNLFETTIRVLGGLLSTYALTGDSLFLEKADTLAEAMTPAFATATGVPYSDVNLKKRSAHGPSGSGDSSTAEVTSLQLEWRWLAEATGKAHYADLVTKVSDVVDAQPKADHLVPFYINVNSGHFTQTTLTMGARADSYYEYLLKQWLLSGKSQEPKELRMRTAYEEAMQGVRNKLLGHSTGRLQLTFIGEVLTSGKTDPKMDHLVCFLPGTLALGAANGAAPDFRSLAGGLRSHPDMILAEELMRTCYEGYRAMAAHLAPEIWRFKTGGTPGEGDDFVVSRRDSHNLLRPETVESLHVLHHLTGNKTYQEWGWKIFQAFEEHTKVASGGYTDLDSVQELPPPRRDKMETFFLGETLKYLFLLFGDDESVLPLHEWVFNTEAHPLPIGQGWGKPPS